MRSTPCVVSVADHAGWAHFVCVAAASNVPAVIKRRRVATIDDDLPTMPSRYMIQSRVERMTPRIGKSAVGTHMVGCRSRVRFPSTCDAL